MKGLKLAVAALMVLLMLDVTFTGAVLGYYGYFDLQRVSMIQNPGDGPGCCERNQAVPFHAVTQT